MSNLLTTAQILAIASPQIWIDPSDVSTHLQAETLTWDHDGEPLTPDETRSYVGKLQNKTKTGFFFYRSSHTLYDTNYGGDRAPLDVDTLPLPTFYFGPGVFYTSSETSTTFVPGGSINATSELYDLFVVLNNPAGFVNSRWLWLFAGRDSENIGHTAWYSPGQDQEAKEENRGIWFEKTGANTFRIGFNPTPESSAPGPLITPDIEMPTGPFLLHIASTQGAVKAFSVAVNSYSQVDYLLSAASESSQLVSVWSNREGVIYNDVLYSFGVGTFNALGVNRQRLYDEHDMLLCEYIYLPGAQLDAAGPLTGHLMEKWGVEGEEEQPPAEPVTFDEPSRWIFSPGLHYNQILTLPNAVSVEVYPESSLFGSDWLAFERPEQPGDWIIGGTLPTFRAGTYLHLLARNSADEEFHFKFPVIVAQASTLTPREVQLYYGSAYAATPTANLLTIKPPNFEKIKIWLDPSVTQNVQKSFNQPAIHGLIDRASSFRWSVQSSETVSTDEQSFIKDGLAFSESSFVPGFNTQIILDKSTCVVARNNGSQVDADLPFRGLPVTESGITTILMIVDYNAPAFQPAPASFYALAVNDFESVGQYPLTNKDVEDFGAIGVRTSLIGETNALVSIGHDRTADLISEALSEGPYDSVGGLDGAITSVEPLDVSEKALLTLQYGPGIAPRIRINKIPAVTNYSGIQRRENTYVADLLLLAHFDAPNALESTYPASTTFQVREVGTNAVLAMPALVPSTAYPGDELNFGATTAWFLTRSDAFLATGVNDFTLDFVATVKIDNTINSLTPTLFQLGGANGITLRFNGSLPNFPLELVIGNGSAIIGNYSIPDRTFQNQRNIRTHYLIVRKTTEAGSRLVLKADGQQLLDIPYPSAIEVASLRLGGTPTEGTGFVGLIDELRMVALAIENEPVPQAPYNLNAYTTFNRTIATSDAEFETLGFAYPQVIGAFGSPDGYVFGSIGDIIVLDGEISDSELQALETVEIAEWIFAQNDPPEINNLVEREGFIGASFEADFTVYNGNGNSTVVRLYDAPIDWSVRKLDPAYNRDWVLSGTWPSTPGPFNIRIEATTDGQTASETFTMTALNRPPAAVIGTLAPTQGATGGTFDHELTIADVTDAVATEVTIVSSGGSNWTITPVPTFTNRFRVVGTLPAVTSSFEVTIRVINHLDNATVTTVSERTFLFRALEIENQTNARYPLDPTGQVAGNKIIRETHTTTLKNGRDRQMIVPILGPFFGDTLVVEYASMSLHDTVARPKIDYIPVCEAQDLSSLCASKVYGAIAIMNDGMEGEIEITYQTLGGNLVIDRNALYEQLLDRLFNPRRIDWSDIIDVPTYLPVAEHEHGISTDFVGFDSFKDTLEQLAQSTTARQMPNDVVEIFTHLTQAANEHSVTKAQIGLSLVNNFPPATVTQATDVDNETTFLTPLTGSASAKANLVNATETIAGVAALNLGTAAGDANNPTDGLTADGVYNLMTSPSDNEFKQEFSNGQVVVKVSPFPVVFPCYWQGHPMRDINDLIKAVEAHMDIYPIVYNHATGDFLFPRSLPGDTSLTPPSMVTRQTVSAYSFISTDCTIDCTKGVAYSNPNYVPGTPIAVVRNATVDDTVDTPLQYTEIIIPD